MINYQSESCCGHTGRKFGGGDEGRVDSIKENVPHDSWRSLGFFLGSVGSARSGAPAQVGTTSLSGYGTSCVGTSSRSERFRVLRVSKFPF